MDGRRRSLVGSVLVLLADGRQLQRLRGTKPDRERGTQLPFGTCQVSWMSDTANNRTCAANRGLVIVDLDQPDVSFRGVEHAVETQCAYPQAMLLSHIKEKCTSQLEYRVPSNDTDTDEEISCPHDPNPPRGHEESRYQDRVAAGQCSSAHGMWGGQYTRSYHCYMQWAGRGWYKVGDRVLDWGSGCGHQASWMRLLFGVRVFGIDVEASAVEWASRNSMGSFCSTDGSKLAFLPDNHFHHVFTMAAIHHLAYAQQCSVLHQFLRVTQNGGSIALMWHGNHLLHHPSPSHAFWRRCVETSMFPQSLVTIAEDKSSVVGPWGLGTMDEIVPGSKRHVPNYSVRVVVNKRLVLEPVVGLAIPELASSEGEALAQAGSIVQYDNIVDVVIPSDLTSTGCADRDHLELYGTLCSLSTNAPWVRYVWLLVDAGSAELHNIDFALPLDIVRKIRFVNRCALVEDLCPTVNTFAVQTVIHRIPGLAERFILLDDDIILGRPSEIAHFFDPAGKPFIWKPQSIDRHHHIYNQSASVFPGLKPTSVSPMLHWYYPMLKSYATELAETYAEWYAFIRSHRTSRYTEPGIEVSEDEMWKWAEAEDLQGVWTSMLQRSGKGMPRNITDRKHMGTEWVELGFNRYTKSGFRQLQKHLLNGTAARFMNVNDRFSKKAALRELQREWYAQALSTVYPPQTNQSLLTGTKAGHKAGGSIQLTLPLMSSSPDGSQTKQDVVALIDLIGMWKAQHTKSSYHSLMEVMFPPERTMQG